MAYTPDIVYYHYPCSDGISAAAVVKEYYADVDINFQPLNYADKPPISEMIETCRGKHILFVDVSLKEAEIDQLQQSAESILILDHHKGVVEDLADFDIGSGGIYVNNIEQYLAEQKTCLIFDGEFCGAVVAHHFFFMDKPITPFLEYIQHIDLGRSSFKNTGEFRAWSRSKPFDINLFRDMIFREYTTTESLESIFSAGKGILEFMKVRIDILVDEMRFGRFGKYRFPFTITDYAFASDAANRMVEASGDQFAMAFYFTQKGIGASIRSVKEFDCIPIAKAFGGNGHPQAAGFNIKWEDFGDFIDALEENGTDIFA